MTFLNLLLILITEETIGECFNSFDSFSHVRLLSAVSYNQPKLCPSAIWHPNAETFATGQWYWAPFGLFVDTNDTVYVAIWSINTVQVWFKGSANPARNIFSGLSFPMTMFATTNDDIYIDNGANSRRIDKWELNGTGSTSAMSVAGACLGLFVDTNDTLYCSMRDLHMVVKKSVRIGNSNVSVTAAGSGTPGSSSTQLRHPHGIFIDLNFTLFVADCDNNRIQRFWFGDLNGTTVAGAGALFPVTLSRPTGVVLDADGYLFIVEWSGNRIVGSGPNGFRCVAACSGQSGSSVTKLINPAALSFDSHGNIFVTDSSNHRVQKFHLATDSCGEFVRVIRMKY